MSKQLAILLSRSYNKNEGTIRPQLTSLVDVLTILLVFLIKSFSVEGNLVTPSPDLELPVSSSKETPKPVTTIEITRNSIMAEGSVLATIESFAFADSMTIPVLHEWMMAKNQGATDKMTNEVLIQSDREVEFNVVKRVMYTCSQAGFSEFSILVLEQG